MYPVASYNFPVTYLPPRAFCMLKVWPGTTGTYNGRMGSNRTLRPPPSLMWLRPASVVGPLFGLPLQCNPHAHRLASENSWSIFSSLLFSLSTCFLCLPRRPDRAELTDQACYLGLAGIVVMQSRESFGHRQWRARVAGMGCSGGDPRTQNRSFAVQGDDGQMVGWRVVLCPNTQQEPKDLVSL